MASEYLSYADFDGTQESLIRAEVDATVRWHRQHELPRYAVNIDAFQQRFLRSQVASQDVEWLFATTKEMTRAFAAKDPLLQLLPLFKNLSDTQVAQIATKFNDEFKQQQREKAKDKDKDPAKLSLKKMQDFFKRTGLELNDQQKTAIIGHLRKRQTNQQQEQLMWRGWTDELLAILRSRHAPDFAKQFSQHYDSRLDLQENQHPEQWSHNRQTTLLLILELFQSLNEQQKTSMLAGLDRFKNVALELSKEAPDD